MQKTSKDSAVVAPAATPVKLRPAVGPSIISGLGVYAVSTALVLLGVSLGIHLLASSKGGHSIVRVPQSDNGYVEAMSRWDGQWYLQIATAGYAYSTDQESSVAFAPLYPLLIRSVHWLTGMPIDLSALLISHVCLVGALSLLIAYLRDRFPSGSSDLSLYAAMACALFPTSFFMRMVYTESPFLFLSLAAFVGMQRKWPLVIVALIIGLATATREVGVALALAMAYHVWERSVSWRQALARLVYLGPLAVWGLLAYMLFQWSEFGDPLAFVKSHQHWYLRPPLGFGERLLGLLSWEPIWSVFTPGCHGYWAEIDKGVPLFLSYHFANPALFLFAGGLLLLGVAKHWLTPCEVIFGVFLLAIPYFTVGFTFCMGAQGRYMCAVFPIYVVLGNLLCRLPLWASTGILTVFAVYETFFAAMFAGDYFIV